MAAIAATGQVSSSPPLSPPHTRAEYDRYVTAIVLSKIALGVALGTGFLLFPSAFPLLITTPLGAALYCIFSFGASLALEFGMTKLREGLDRHYASLCDPAWIKSIKDYFSQHPKAEDVKKSAEMYTRKLVNFKSRLAEKLEKTDTPEEISQALWMLNDDYRQIVDTLHMSKKTKKTDQLFLFPLRLTDELTKEFLEELFYDPKEKRLNSWSYETKGTPSPEAAIAQEMGQQFAALWWEVMQDPSFDSLLTGLAFETKIDKSYWTDLVASTRKILPSQGQKEAKLSPEQAKKTIELLLAFTQKHHKQINPDSPPFRTLKDAETNPFDSRHSSYLEVPISFYLLVSAKNLATSLPITSPAFLQSAFDIILIAALAFAIYSLYIYYKESYDRIQ